tara:strand:+ start:531 stop:779 length:249 start_codon:yes stop_codon:yes gene_type:complete
MNINESYPDCGKTYSATLSDAQTTHPHRDSNQRAKETLAIKQRLQLIFELEQKKKWELATLQSQKEEKPSSLWKRLTSRLSK